MVCEHDDWTKFDYQKWNCTLGKHIWIRTYPWEIFYEHLINKFHKWFHYYLISHRVSPHLIKSSSKPTGQKLCNFFTMVIKILFLAFQIFHNSFRSPHSHIFWLIWVAKYWNQNTPHSFCVLRDRPQVLYIFGKLVNRAIR